MTQEPDPKSYSLENLEMWITDAIESDCDSDEIYNVLVEVVKQNMRYHKACFSTSVKLYSKLRGNPHGLDVIDNTDVNLDKEYTEKEYWNGEVPEREFDRYLKKYGYEYTPTGEDKSKFKLDSPHLHPNDEGIAPPYTLDSYNAMEQDPDTAHKTHQEMIDAGYEMTADGFWIPKDKDE